MYVIRDYYNTTCNHCLYHKTRASLVQSVGADARDSEYLRVKYNSTRLRGKKYTQVTPKLDSVRGNNKINCTSRQQQKNTTLHRVVSSIFFH